MACLRRCNELLMLRVLHRRERKGVGSLSYRKFHFTVFLVIKLDTNFTSLWSNIKTVPTVFLLLLGCPGYGPLKTL